MFSDLKRLFGGQRGHLATKSVFCQNINQNNSRNMKIKFLNIQENKFGKNTQLNVKISTNIITLLKKIQTVTSGRFMQGYVLHNLIPTVQCALPLKFPPLNYMTCMCDIKFSIMSEKSWDNKHFFFYNFATKVYLFP